jgi:hypothetical protein
MVFNTVQHTTGFTPVMYNYPNSTFTGNLTVVTGIFSVIPVTVTNFRWTGPNTVTTQFWYSNMGGYVAMTSTLPSLTSSAYTPYTSTDRVPIPSIEQTFPIFVSLSGGWNIGMLKVTTIGQLIVYSNVSGSGFPSGTDANFVFSVCYNL